MPYLTYHDGETVQRFELTRKLTSVGSGPGSKIRLSDPAVLPQHATILRDGKSWMLSSLDREAVLIVNGKDRRHYSLQDGDLIVLGGTELTFSTRELQEDSVRRINTSGSLAAVAAVPSPDSDERLNRIARFAEMLLLGMQVPDIFKTLLDAVIDLCGATKGFLIHCRGESLHIAAARNVDRVDIGSGTDEVSDSVIERVLREKRPLIVSDTMNDTILGQSRSVVDLRLSSVMCVPLMARDQLIGILYVGTEGPGKLFTQSDLELLKIFAAQAGLILHNALLLDDLRIDNVDLAREAAQGRGSGGAMIGSDESMLGVFRMLDRVAPTDISVLVNGETGTGKELVARELHLRSNRRDGPFVSINCGAIPENLLESELFGHKKGAFTGALADKQGKFEDANGGTLFLDEIGEMPMNLQVKLLRVLQEREIERVGEGRPRKVDIRVISATNKDLEEEISAGRFREDLYYRLNEIRITLPPLRDRGDDIVLIANALMKRYAKLYPGRAVGLSPEGVAAIRSYVWPGNVRQLENRLKKAVVLSDGPLISPADLGISERAEVSDQRWQPLNDAREAFQQQYIHECLEAHEWNKAATARALDVDPRTIFRYIEKFRDA